MPPAPVADELGETVDVVVLGTSFAAKDGNPLWNGPNLSSRN